MHIYLWFCVLAASVGGVVFGYHTGIIAGAMLFIRNEFHLSSTMQGVTVSIILLGALCGSFLAGFIADRLGRKRAFFTAALLLLLGTSIAVFATSTTSLLLGRFLSGVSVGLYSVVTPMYLSEISSKERRGMIVAFYQLSVSIGILLAYGVALLLAHQENWREMLAWGLVPGFVQLMALPFLAESPQWLMGKNHVEKGQKEAKRLKIKAEAPHSFLHPKWKALLAPGVRLAFIIGVSLSAFQQFSGINAVFYFAPQIFELIGLPSQDVTLTATLGLGTINLLTAALAVWLLDRWGRKILLIVGTSGMALALGALACGMFFSYLDLHLLSAIALMAYVVFFGISLGPVTWVIISEIYPLNIRGRAMSIAILINWLSNYLISLIFLDLVVWVGAGGVFVLFMCFCLFALYFVARWLPETKGKSYEEIQGLFNP